MGTNSVDRKWVQPISAENEEGDDEEALSLCDLPINEENQSRKEEEKEAAAQSIMNTWEEFDFGSRGGFVLTETEMCAADEVFFQGQILPLRYYVSSDTGSAVPRVGIRNPIRSISRSGSMDRSHSSGLTSVSSSSSSSIRSQHSSSSGTTHEKRLQSQFLTRPSPTPQTRLPNVPYGNVSHQSRLKSTRMSYFRVGLVPTPGIELRDLKLRCNSNNRTRTSDCEKNGSKIEKKKKKKRRALFRSCKCSVDAVETVPLMVDDMMMIRSGRNNASEVEEKEDQKVEPTKKKKKKKEEDEQATSHRRTCEWLKELSLVGGPDEA